MENKGLKALPKPKISKSKSKNGKYVAEFYWYKDGKKAHTNTKSFTTKERAISVALSKQRLSMENYTPVENKQDKTIGDALGDFIAYQDKKSKNRNYDKMSKYSQLRDDAKSLRAHYTKSKLLSTKIVDLEDEDFKDWIEYINDVEINEDGKTLSGSRVQSYQKTIKEFSKFLNKNDYLLFDKKLQRRLVDEMKTAEDIKKKGYGKREKVYVPKVLDINIFCSEYDRGTFRGEYCYVLFKFLFFSGLRISEAIALQWKNIDFKRGMIHVENSINQKELRENVMYRINNEVGRTKNKKSRRCIPIMEIYYNLLKDYKNNYKFHYKLSDQYMDDAFVFPQIQLSNFDKQPYNYQTHKWILHEVKKQCDITGIPYFPTESLRHACATFIAKDLRILESEAYDLFGHTDNKMLKDVYAELDAEDKATRIALRQKGLFYYNEAYEKELNERIQKNKKKYSKGEELTSEIYREKFLAVKDKLKHLVEKGNQYYIYPPEDEQLVLRAQRVLGYDNDIITLIKEDK